MVARTDVSVLADTLNEIVKGARRDLAEIAQALIDTPDEMKREVMLESMYGLVSDYGDAAAVESLGWYLALRAEAVGLDDGFQPSLPAQLPEDVVHASTRWALGELMKGEDLDKALKPLNGVLDRLVKKLGRESIVRAADSDPKKPRWARIPHGQTCAWCLMLASRGWVYLDAQSAGAARQWHADCDCQIVPAWGKKTPKIAGYDPDALYAQYEAARDAVIESKQGKHGYSPSLAEVASSWREMYNRGRGESVQMPKVLRDYSSGWPEFLELLRPGRWQHILARHGMGGNAPTTFGTLDPEDIALLLLASVQNDRKSWDPGIYPDTYQGHTDVPGIGIVRCVYQMKNGTVSVRSFYPIENKEAEDYVGLGKS
jgi:hypothetical protein